MNIQIGLGGKCLLISWFPVLVVDSRHRNPAVRSMTARMTTKLIEKLGADRCLSEVPERLLPMLCRFLQEGSLDTRYADKILFRIDF